MTARTVCVLAGHAPSLVRFRGRLLEAMIARGWRVVAMAPDAKARDIEDLRQIGVEFVAVPMARATVDPRVDIRTVLALFRHFRQLRPDIVLSYTVKAVIYGSLAARLAGVARITAMITGLGFAFGEASDLRRRALRVAVEQLYRRALACCAVVYFQNPDDLALFRERRLLSAATNAVLIDGSGVDLDQYAPTDFPQSPSFLMIARLIREKGVFDYVAAARLLQGRFPHVRCRLVGWIDAAPGAVDQRDLDDWVGEGVIDYLGVLDDVRPALAGCAVFVLPSYYREGTPRTILEAMAMGRPVLTTDLPGCRETVVPGENGFFVAARAVEELAAAMARFVETPELIPRMGAASRRLAERRFDVHSVNKAILQSLDIG